MGREKRKTRLNKGEATEFIGFGAFASPTAATTPAATTDVAPSISSAPSTGNSVAKSPGKSSLALAPVYLGSESELTLLFPRIGQKRDATTNTKALQDLKHYFNSDTPSKKAQVDALAHLLYLYQSKLHYDNTPRVRAAALDCSGAAMQRVPKAFITLATSQPELVGMMISGNADPASDVRKSAEHVYQLLMELKNSSSDEETAELMRQGIWDYVQRILSYQKPLAMHQDLFQKKSQGDSTKLSEKQEEELDEKFVRIVGTAISGLQWYLQHQQPVASASAISSFPEDTKYLWKSLTSPKSALRRKAYQLLSTCCQQFPHLIDTSKLANVLQQNLSSEKEPTNVKILLETLLALVSTVSRDDRTTFLSQFAKPLTKLFSKGCHGANQWAPTVLPIVALLPADDQPTVLTSVWQGKSALVGTADQLEVVAAVAETATFLLLQKKPHDLAEVLAECWFQAFQVFVTKSIGNAAGTFTGGPIGRAYDDLGQILAKDLQRLDRAREMQPTSSAVVIDDWFWKTKLSAVLFLDAAVDLQQVIRLVQQVPITATPAGNHLLHLWKKLFHYHLEHCQASSGLVPGLELYQLWMVLLERISMQDIFDQEASSAGSTTSTTMETFVMNDLLRWMVIHTSSLSDQFDMDLAKYDFELYHRCHTSQSDGGAKGASLWHPLLRELVAAKCDLEALVAGLVIVTQAAGLDAVRSTILEDLCRQVAKEAIDELHAEDHDSDDDFTDATELHMHYHRKASDLLQTCVGLGEVDGVLVNKSVVSDWTDMACPRNPNESRSSNAVLETLVALVKDGYFQQAQDVERILLQTWRQGGDLWKETVLPWICKNSVPLIAVIQEASSELQSTVRQASSEGNVDTKLLLQWAERAVRLFELCPTGSKERKDLPLPSLELVGLAEPRIWDYRSTTKKGSASFILLKIMSLLGDVDATDWEYRWSLFSNCATIDPDHLLMLILLHLSDGAANVLLSDRARRRQDESFTLLMHLGGKLIPSDRLYLWIKSFLPTISSLFALGDDHVTCRGVAVLSQLISIDFSILRPNLTNEEQGKLVANKIHEGDSVWYLSDAQKEEDRQLGTIIQVHNEIPTEVYFTIKVEHNGKILEKQTVAERLRSSPYDPEREDASLIPVNRIDLEESAGREQVLTLLMKDLVSSGWDSWQLYEFEILNILITQLGLLDQRGIGSLHYIVFQKLMSLQTQLVGKVDATTSPEDFPASGMWSLALALGYGCNVPPSPWNIPLVGFDPEAMVGALLNLWYDSEIEWLKSPSIEIMRATTVLLTSALPGLKDASKLENAKALLYHLVEKALKEAAKENGFTQDDYLCLRAIESAQGAEEASTEQDAVVEVVGAFASRWEKDETAKWLDMPLGQSVLEGILSKRPRLAGVAARRHGDILASSLFVDGKRWLSLRFLAAYATQGNPIHDSSDNAMNQVTAQRLKMWSANLVSEEAEELEEDVELVCQWVPKVLMNQVESWQDAASQDYHVNEPDAVGRLTSWLAYLRIAHVSSSKDSMNRTALTSYTRKCGAVDAILNLAMLYANVGTDRKVKFETVIKVDDLFSTGQAIELSKLAASVLFQTVELFPTLSKYWWETSCPNYFRDAVKDFVETNVAPELLRRELKRIKAVTSFGDMTVKGSAISREITALYRQDDFTLSAVIKLPPSFPFRRAEVDCSKTLGVPEGRWKRWSLQITQMLNNQGGTLTDALLLWKENVDKEFEGIEPCPVCYSVLHVKTHKLPDMQCKTCQNRFHFDCLTQWFRSSGKSACVLCQQPWAGTRVS